MNFAPQNFVTDWREKISESHKRNAELKLLKIELREKDYKQWLN